MTRHRLFACVPAIALAGACSGGHSSPTDAGDDDAQFASCLQSHPDRVMAYMAGVSVPSSGGSFVVTLLTNHPGYPEDNMAAGPEVKGVNTWNMQIVNAAQAPVDGMVMTASPYMPDHQHGTSIVPVVTGQGGGDYQVAPLYLYMSGYWEITLDMQAPPSGDAAVPDETAVFKTCIP
jgi:hypothetical protein